MADVRFTKKTWADGSSGGTPITASELNRMEQGIKDCADGVNDLGDSISPMVTHRTNGSGLEVLEWSNNAGDDWAISINTDGSLSIRKNLELLRNIS